MADALRFHNGASASDPRPGVSHVRSLTQTFRMDGARQANNFDFLRLALAVLVLYSHCYPLGTGSEAAEPIRRLTHGQMTGGAVAVDLFFVMSGFLITASAERSRSVGSYFGKRFARIYPAFVVAAVLAVALVLPVSGGTLLPGTAAQRAGGFVLQTLRLREFLYVNAFARNPYPDAINGSLWSVQYEFWCYLGVALLLAGGFLKHRVVLLLAFVAAVIVSVLFLVRGWIFGGKWLGVLLGSPQLWARLLPMYLAGVVFFLWRDRIRFHFGGACAALLLLGLACVLPFGCAALFPLAGAYLVFYLAFSPALRLHGFGRFGDFSYGTYLYAFPVEQMLMKGFGRPVQPSLLFCCAAPLTLLLAVGSWYGVERRFLRPGRRKEAAPLP